MYIIYKNYPINSDFWYYLNNKSVDEMNLELRIPIDTMYLLSTNTLDDSVFSAAYSLDWNLPKGSITSIIFDKNIAIDVFLNIIRDIRLPLFTPLDVAYMRALESNNQSELVSIATQKQQLRDCTNIDFSNVETLDDIKSLWPVSILGVYPY